MRSSVAAVALLLALLGSGCSGGGSRPATPTANPFGAAATPSTNVAALPSARAVVSGLFADLLGDLVAKDLPSGADSPLLSYLPDIHGFDHYTTFDIARAAPDSQGNGTERAGKIAQKGSAGSASVSASLIATVWQPKDKDEAGRIAAGIRGIAAADVQAALHDGEAAKFGLTITSIRMLSTEGLGDGAVGFESAVTTDPNNQLTVSLASTNSHSATIRAILLVRGARVGAILRVGAVNINPEGPPGTDPDLALAQALDAKLKAAD